ncbi:MAG: N-acetyltransferase family protein [Pseudomonadales bacterium]|jgi:L-amino acid N-acyltransferase YncA|tara:strand:+ start:1658 stop:2248 length:591 start_codon:yes stop_codon:yes gene_type:complete
MSDINLNERYPKAVTLPDGATVEIRLMNATDRDAMLSFARSLPQEDLLFLRLDLTEPSVIDDWVHNIETGHSTSIIAYDDTGVIGYATVHRNPTPWTRRMGELRVNVSQSYRARGLGKNLTSEIFDIARGIGVKKLMANMTADQHGAQAAFRRLGFVPEAMLADYVEDRNGVSRDLVIMSYDIEGHLNQVADIVKI